MSPGWGGQAYDAEALYLTWNKKADGKTYLYLGLVTGHRSAGCKTQFLDASGSPTSRPARHRFVFELAAQQRVIGHHAAHGVPKARAVVHHPQVA